MNSLEVFLSYETLELTEGTTKKSIIFGYFSLNSPFHDFTPSGTDTHGLSDFHKVISTI